MNVAFRDDDDDIESMPSYFTLINRVHVGVRRPTGSTRFQGGQGQTGPSALPTAPPVVPVTENQPQPVRETIYGVPL